MKRLADILLSLAALLLLAACTDDADVYNTPASSEGNLCVYVPVTREGDEVKSSLDPSNPTYNASVEECQINDLHLYAFPVDGKGTFLSQELLAPEANEMLNEQVARYQLQIKPGTYHVYVVANMEDALKGTTINTEDDLKDVVLSYAPMSKSGMPVAKNIPMIYEPKAADGTTTEVTIKKTDTTPKTVAANLRFTCVKVCLNLIYDPNAAGVSPALKNGMIINDVKAERLSPSTKLLWDGKFSNPSLDASSTYAKGFESSLYEHASATGVYYSDWKEDLTHVNDNNNNIITPKSAVTSSPVNIKQKWLFRATYYLPERYVKEAAQQSALKIGGAVGGHNNSYNINLGHRKDETSTTEVPTFPRGTYYEIVGRIKSLGNIDLDCVVGVKEWKLAEVDADLTHTTLWVSKTSAKVTSLQNAIIDYKTNADASNITFGCVDVVQKDGGGKLPIVVMSQHDPAKKRVTFSINPELSVKDFTDAKVPKGTAKVWIKAGNIKKYLDVEYDVTPYFKVDPVDIVIFYDPKNPSELTKVVKFTTNLGGIQFPSDRSDWKKLSDKEYEVKYAQSTIRIKCDNTNVADGTFTITATSNPETTTTHVFTVKSIDAVKDAANKDIYKEQEIRVTVRPPKGNYFIYMRAINDLVWCNGNNNDDYMHSLMLDEDSRIGTVNNNWRDGWWEAKEDKGNNNWQNVTWNEDYSPHHDYHFVYIYTQIGETAPGTGSQDRKTKEWYFVKPDRGDLTRHTVWDDDSNFGTNEWWPGHSMLADQNNPGWYYISIPTNKMSVGKKETNEDKMIKPGQTLLIFSNGTYLAPGFQSHRFTHHNDPGITLFNYEDNEGWYLYDPTCNPYYRVYDEKPTVVDVEYTIYTKRDGISGWYVDYGVNSQDGTGKFKMKSDNPNVENEFKCTKCPKTDKDGNTWYKTILHLKAPLGYYDKILHVKISNKNLDTELFDGDNYPVSGTVTRTINGRNCVRYVVEGSYDTDTQTWRKGDPFKK
ncbi:fimbrial protein [Prevotella sp.]|uniref:fimbrial protein n=1 Tax=Prevotella sp. TaxID=59823 RepID=UPI0027E381E5|nr:fimbrial protein [Prevotella sp.]